VKTEKGETVEMSKPVEMSEVEFSNETFYCNDDRIVFLVNNKMAAPLSNRLDLVFTNDTIPNINSFDFELD